VRRLRAYARVVPDLVGPDAGDGVAERIAAAAALAVAILPAEQREVLLLSCVGFGWSRGGQWDYGKVGVLG
jgi:hypothetical protein